MKIQVRYVLNPLFLTALILLLLNDLFLKQAFHNGFTGKLSDLAGPVVLVFFLRCLLPERYKLHIFVSCALMFIAWKSPVSQPLINLWNTSFSGFQITRVIDAGDTLCLLVLIPLYSFSPDEPRFRRGAILYPVLGITLAAMLSTSRARSFHGQSVVVNEMVRVDMTASRFLDQLVKDGASYTLDSVNVVKGDTFKCYQVIDIFLKSDTIYSAQIGLREKRKKTEVYIGTLQVAEDQGPIFVDYKDYKEWAKRYRVMSLDYFRKND